MPKMEFGVPGLGATAARPKTSRAKMCSVDSGLQRGLTRGLLRREAIATATRLADDRFRREAEAKARLVAGEVSDRSVKISKTVGGLSVSRGFESHPLR